MRAIATPYRIYKDRFLLACMLSILAHILAYMLYMQLPSPEKKVVLRPIALGVIQPKQSMPNQTTQTHTNQNNAQNQQNTKQPQAKPKQSQPNPTPMTPQANTQPPSTNIDPQSFKPTTNQGAFDPFATPQPSLTQSLNLQAQNATFDKLPSKIRNELYQLYGTELNTMSKEAKDYLAESYFLNAEVFQQTADRLGYPKLAAYLKQQGVGLIEFVLHPDGHVDQIKILESTKSEVLDESMRTLIEQSAKNLKRPPQPILIRVRGSYNIHSY